jgi:uncharacterized protein YbjT (DUF2867 family)
MNDTSDMSDMSTPTTLVLGGTGKTGRRVAQRLTALDRPVRIGSRGGEPPFDWNDETTWAPVLDGVHAVYVAYYPDLAYPGAADIIGSFAELAVRHGVRRLVLLSGRGEAGARASEQALQAAGAEWTIVRASFFSQDFSEHFLLGPVIDGVIALPAGDVAEPFVDVEDIADVAVAALTDDRHVGQVYEVTGPRLLTFTEAAGEIARASGREVRYQPVSTEAYVAAAIDAGVPAEDAAPLADLLAGVLDGHNAYLTDGVRRALGRSPRDFADYARCAAASGVWGAEVRS